MKIRLTTLALISIACIVSLPAQADVPIHGTWQGEYTVTNSPNNTCSIAPLQGKAILNEKLGNTKGGEGSTTTEFSGTLTLSGFPNVDNPDGFPDLGKLGTGLDVTGTISVNSDGNDYVQIFDGGWTMFDGAYTENPPTINNAQSSINISTTCTITINNLVYQG